MQVGLMAPQGWKGEYDGWRPQDAWARTMELAAQAESLGFESLWVFDHFHTVPEPTDEMTFESFAVLAALAVSTERVRLGPHGRLHGLPEPGADGEAVLDHRRHQRRPLRARHRRRLEGGRVAGVRLRLPAARRAPRRPRRSPRGHQRDVRARAAPRSRVATRTSAARSTSRAASRSRASRSSSAATGRGSRPATRSSTRTSSTTCSSGPTRSSTGCARCASAARPRDAIRRRSASRSTRATSRCATPGRPGWTSSAASRRSGSTAWSRSRRAGHRRSRRRRPSPRIARRPGSPSTAERPRSGLVEDLDRVRRSPWRPPRLALDTETTSWFVAGEDEVLVDRGAGRRPACVELVAVVERLAGRQRDPLGLDVRPGQRLELGRVDLLQEIEAHAHARQRRGR